MKTQPLQLYFDCLMSFSSQQLDLIDDSTEFDLVLVKNLIDEGCLSGIEASTYDGLSFRTVSITPHGAVVLAKWGSLLRANSPQGQFFDALGKIVWLLAGMVITITGSLLLRVLE